MDSSRTCLFCLWVLLFRHTAGSACGEKESLARSYADGLAILLRYTGQKDDVLLLMRDCSNEPDGITWSKRKMVAAKVRCWPKMDVRGAAAGLDFGVSANWRNGGIFVVLQNRSL